MLPLLIKKGAFTLTIEKGEQVQPFVLKDHNGEEFRLEDHKGKKVLLSFHPLAWTKVCARQMQVLDEKQETFQEHNTVVVGISADPVPTKKAWADHLGIKHTPLLSDFWPHGAFAQQLGLFRDKEGFSERANILLDEEHKVMFTKIYPLPENPNIDEILEQIK